MTDYENQLATLRLEVKRLRNYDCYTKDTQYQDLQTEVCSFWMSEAVDAKTSCLHSFHDSSFEKLSFYYFKSCWNYKCKWRRCLVSGRP